ncbi:MAG: FeoB-associated Cys-rich membrane protein [Butyricicoccaceae bacterium]
MSIADYVILGVLAVLVVCAVRYITKHPSSCGGDCAHCGKQCQEKK